MMGCAIQVMNVTPEGFWKLTLKEYRQAINAWVQLNDPDGSRRQAAKSKIKKGWDPALDADLFEIMDRMNEENG